MPTKTVSKTNKTSFMMNDFQGIQQYLYNNMNQNCANLAMKPLYNLLRDLVGLKVSRTGMVHFLFKDCSNRASMYVYGSFSIDVVVENAVNSFKSDCDEVFSLMHQMKTEAQFEVESYGQLNNAFMQPDNTAMFTAFQPTVRSYGSINDVFLDWSLGNGCYCFVLGQRKDSSYIFRLVFYYGYTNAIKAAQIYMGSILSKFGPFFGNAYTKGSMIYFGCMVDSKQLFTEEQFKSVIVKSEFFKKFGPTIPSNVTCRLDNFKSAKTGNGYEYSIDVCVHKR